mmetsp:Transcript_23062/g.43297  ORF Transcript_23062/g.43297 Transcript_23062/m.43297 type:complete len:248 (-) Transcript_23062:175-918(-)|eukprot:CAMPEP_0170179670 /NCGR_PEP_ID=MMETSP0040_2-20121228/18632_1 /TAXON_ID=641309 /ORGANISM="Lotharella oceanica, Strain CCMP622" /LENGTH=247 /DNA_ID=CAMNT_0010423901 /DNA_START=33 /DNA_END=776 /DNA_ORIENTATION=+
MMRASRNYQYALPPLNSRQVVELRKLFDFLEEGKGGVLTPFKLHTTLHKLGYKLKMEKVEEILSAFDGSMKFSDFLCFMSDRTKKFQGADSMVLAFKMMDHNRDGLIEVSRFKITYEVLLPQASSQQHVEIVRKIFNPDRVYHGVMEIEFSPGDPGLTLSGEPCKVVDVKGFAEKSGVRKGWFATKVDGKRVESADHVLSIIKQRNTMKEKYKLEFSFEKVMGFREFCKFGQLDYEDFVSVMRTFST